MEGILALVDNGRIYILWRERREAGNQGMYVGR